MVESQRGPPSCVLQRLSGESFIMAVDEAEKVKANILLYILKFFILNYTTSGFIISLPTLLIWMRELTWTGRRCRRTRQRCWRPAGRWLWMWTCCRSLGGTELSRGRGPEEDPGPGLNSLLDCWEPQWRLHRARLFLGLVSCSSKDIVPNWLTISLKYINICLKRHGFLQLH